METERTCRVPYGHVDDAKRYDSDTLPYPITISSSKENLVIIEKNVHYKIFCVNRNTGFKFELHPKSFVSNFWGAVHKLESRIFYFINLQNEENYERKESSSAR